MYETKDSGKRKEWRSGFKRDVTDGKPDYTLLPYEILKRWAELMTRGASKYGKHNWKLAKTQEEMERFKQSAFRHFMQWISGQEDEDHATAVMFNISAYEWHTKHKNEK